MSKNDYDERQKRFLHYLENRNMTEETIETCVGEIRIVIDALADYADIVAEKTQIMPSSYGKAVWENRLQKIKNVQKKLEDSIGYNRDKQLENCGKKKLSKQEDVGSDALELAARKESKK